ncbi:hypothetical protein LTR10_003320 [Elasticomyces elasticus]|uniref:Uncharacterized protein n=1 Tax=Elasticomyces elasticus TaxID=574655 RepID=A0AAN7WCD0_9PEZI|nr:hypothetical protein LTR10_003320 [Elasticomyces elasticus]KAK4969590.1 hypothetical protein LTR42_008862 [Elasticomyces elasticus]KAK5700063.1 hypothetical protein LTR97_006198 [Elasticomyces elasticus]
MAARNSVKLKWLNLTSGDLQLLQARRCLRCNGGYLALGGSSTLLAASVQLVSLLKKMQVVLGGGAEAAVQ